MLLNPRDSFWSDGIELLYHGHPSFVPCPHCALRCYLRHQLKLLALTSRFSSVARLAATRALSLMRHV
jgi:hypothetical protein